MGGTPRGVGWGGGVGGVRPYTIPSRVNISVGMRERGWGSFILGSRGDDEGSVGCPFSYDMRDYGTCFFKYDTDLFEVALSA